MALTDDAIQIKVYRAAVRMYAARLAVGSLAAGKRPDMVACAEDARRLWKVVEMELKAPAPISTPAPIPPVAPPKGGGHP
jgi:hypothetical protein